MSEQRQSPLEDADDNDHNISFMRSTLAFLDQEPEPVPTVQPRSSNSSSNRTRASYLDSRDLRPSNTAAATATALEEQTPPESAEARRVRLQQILARLNRLHDPSAYSNRSPRASTLYDWAPPHEASSSSANNSASNSAGLTTAVPIDSDIALTLAELRQSQPDTHPDILRVLGQSQRELSRQRNAPPATEETDGVRRDRLRERRRRETDWVRARESRLDTPASPSATERMLRYAMDRSQRTDTSEEEERARRIAWYNPSGAPEQHISSSSTANLPMSATELRSRTILERNDARTRRYLENAPPRLPRISSPAVASQPGSSQLLESALKYLNQLRSCSRYEDALSAAIEYSLANKEFFADKHDDFIMDLAEIDPLAGSSWLQPGTSFEGEQHATSNAAALLHSRSNANSRSVEQINPNYRNQSAATMSLTFDHPPGSTRVVPFDATRPDQSRATKPATTGHDHWPVRVVFHAVDPEKMTLQGTMEAYDVPQHPASVSIMNSAERPKAGKKNAPITTYLEGHIIDLTTHSFLTPSPTDTFLQGPHPTNAENATPYTTLSGSISFPAATAATDAANWRKLPPFNSLASDSEAARLMLSRARMNEVNEEYIFMRWKERCFVHGKEDKCSAEDRMGECRGHGLTISGFYYVSLRRSDGSVEGLYFDPSSTPYQCLRLEGVSGRKGWGSCELR